MGAAELQQLLKLSPVDGLRALAFLTESCEDFEALTLAVLLAGLELRRPTQVLGLLFRADADVGDCSDHLPQLRPVRRCWQGARTHLYTVERSCRNTSIRTCAIVSACCRIRSTCSSDRPAASSPNNSRQRSIEIGSGASAELISSIASPSQSSPGHHVNAALGSTERPVKAASPRMRVERSESLDGAEASPKIERVVARLQLTLEPAWIAAMCRVHGSELGAVDQERLVL